MQNILETLFYLHGGCYIMLYPFISWVDCDYWDYSFYLIGRIFYLSFGFISSIGLLSYNIIYISYIYISYIYISYIIYILYIIYYYFRLFHITYWDDIYISEFCILLHLLWFFRMLWQRWPMDARRLQSPSDCVWIGSWFNGDMMVI